MRDLGDYQTPAPLVAAILKRLEPTAERWSRVLEPTCGRGHFLQGLLARESPPREIIGVEIQDTHFRAAEDVATYAPRSVRVRLMRANVFDVDLARGLGWEQEGPLLVVGNPPWVTNSALGALGSANLPEKSNVKRDRGVDAMTGASNFDIAEAIWLKLLNDFATKEATFALLCKTSVARRVLEHARRTSVPIRSAEIVRLNARVWFNAAVDACLLRIDLQGAGQGGDLERIPVFDHLEATQPSRVMGFVRNKLVADLEAYARFSFADGLCTIPWRQGLKHDAASVMELERDHEGTFRNGLGRVVDIEPEHLFPLLKGSDLGGRGRGESTRSVIVTQRKIGENTRGLEASAPRLWNYLHAHADAFDRRKSSVYRAAPPFAMFGIGPYSFEPFKVAVSSLHKTPRFHAIAPLAGRPVMVDDTGYSLACRSLAQASLIASLLNTPESLGLLGSLTFPGAKRQVTKAALQRIDLAALLRNADRPALVDRASRDHQRWLSSGFDPLPSETFERLLELI